MTVYQNNTNLYGHCPICGADVISRERRPNGNDECKNGHTFPSRDVIKHDNIKKENLLFLDIDGVLNSNSYYYSERAIHDERPYFLDSEQLILLKSIQYSTDCDIILSSSWRRHKEAKLKLTEKFIEHNIRLWIGETPELSGERRHEIYSFLSANPRYKRYRVAGLDDWEEAELSHSQVRDTLEFSNYQFFKTDPEVGLTLDQSLSIIDFLNKG